MTADLRPHRVGPIGAHEMRVMAEVLADPNPIHLDPAAVAALGLGDRLINQGPTNLGYVIDLVRAGFPEHRLRRIRTRFLANVHEGDVVLAGGRVDETHADGTVDCTVWLDVEGGARAIEGTATLEPRGR
ncbi:MaoC family dehydratase [Agromyces aerolatus]|uniref:MaoC family dehydratase n=1 Tax=Agromyces sp. LY-1074 TaxID=3074080 RepID=UPI0028548F32|nr:MULTISPECIES: MaoC/PaaZ C-terminal domain-containing protein [unclassified Agromyces]MDR5699756.1 MaoC/PaaZ C-terminal domain-containing protein [Agromyces sp. LY-1074]MDR5706052.1 MaoC/PaaZ C-terminal domain-containing protein [Agromyces sp. LY-1358]